jgi:hypothetical protein
VKGPPAATTARESAPGSNPQTRTMNHSASIHPRRTGIAAAALAMLAAACLAGCATNPQAAETGAPAAAGPGCAGGQWTMVRSDPPTWFPRGLPADHPTDCASGEWVHTGDSRGTRYFLPVHGLEWERRRSLVKEALAARSPEVTKRLAREDAAYLVGSTLTTLAVAPLSCRWTSLTALALAPVLAAGHGMQLD